ncbi:23S rRNA (adenine(2030)-N(6))-methyltransferase RlmJ [Bartonella sp. HY329]|uniref:23S rRNA (adenine(2030)-N(6))-methyltransferase RlmJ n=1 Tax=unclassified Bartonella TaxID=2645622 RepID=UPI0021C6A7E0|nr:MULTISPECIES: 23S rRNA (adenine(2030)-N(6))-methyltransferase RlmJ [unclassified Bartonella]UXM94040.1 23S rRNA (adenine(2030)-N(6))-methyltransferase RlmJ [Bartonella sp. HY329]UXN08362.1 23S rRNA (adenine(2030)-N(6))-methyltransferase RlmJ [Bartonella sp. HY328]
MNYRHIYHAGNFADVFKHIIVTRIIEYLKNKDQAFRVIDTHAGIGLYNLGDQRAQKTGEWKDGVGQIIGKNLDADVLSLIAPWLDIIADLNDHQSVLKKYPGSPILIRKLLRLQDRLTAMELHPDDYKILRSHLEGDFQTKVINLNGWLALSAQLPPKEKRGLVLVDPPFEIEGEFDRLVEGLVKAHKRFSYGVYAFWYPVKHFDAVKKFCNQLYETGIPKILRLELHIRKQSSIASLDGNGMIIVNPPYTLESEMKSLSPFLVNTLGRDAGAHMINQWIRQENN